MNLKTIPLIALGIVLSLLIALSMMAASIDESRPSQFNYSSNIRECDIDEQMLSHQVDRYQRANAVTIYIVGMERGIPEHGIIIALATAMQESSLRNLANDTIPESLELSSEGTGNDHDSLGLFQQRPSQDWGEIDELMDPVYASNAFYDALMQIPEWETLEVADAAQAVQVSAHPDLYAQHESLARELFSDFDRHTECEAVADSDISGSGFTHPLPEGDVGSGFRTSERPDHDGIDIMAPHGTPLVAAGAGEVVTVTCNASLNGEPYSCDVDGSPEVSGCGWYLEILHSDGTLTRYCHLVTEPIVSEGETVQAGQRIGQVGSSGNSSGPHLHLETHLDHPASSASATEPTGYFNQRGVNLN